LFGCALLALLGGHETLTAHLNKVNVVGVGTPTAMATGSVIDPDGYILTAWHVVDQRNIRDRVILADGTQVRFTIVARDVANDLCILKVDRVFKDYVRIGTQPKPGDYVYGLGHPWSHEYFQVNGLVTRKKESWMGGQYNAMRVFMTMAPGLSGCPVVNEQGLLIGVGVGGYFERTPDSNAKHKSWSDDAIVVHVRLVVAMMQRANIDGK